MTVMMTMIMMDVLMKMMMPVKMVLDIYDDKDEDDNDNNEGHIGYYDDDQCGHDVEARNVLDCGVQGLLVVIRRCTASRRDYKIEPLSSRVL
ncbi:hypothetical protein PoB_005031400 [Plakobranchus ocellatus]|uniref:Uncharacterized protein n=1 Tax=Plakobranchus ocellatus TaxID=259542 RepID=A0AAV4BUE5_9GAST|nr:hypothetical protein PoB_005031400 [Plakobranchus ocellatus]